LNCFVLGPRLLPDLECPRLDRAFKMQVQFCLRRRAHVALERHAASRLRPHLGATQTRRSRRLHARARPYPGLWTGAHAALAQLVPGSKHILVDNSDHSMNVFTPQAITDAIKGVVSVTP